MHFCYEFFSFSIFRFFNLFFDQLLLFPFDQLLLFYLYFFGSDIFNLYYF